MVKVLSLLYRNLQATWGRKLVADVSDQQPFEPGEWGSHSEMITLLGHLWASLHVRHARRSRPVLNYRNTVSGSPDLMFYLK